MRPPLRFLAAPALLAVRSALILGVLAVPARAQVALDLTMTASTTTPTLGGGVTFTVVARNTGSSHANNVTVSDVLPAGLAYSSASATDGTYVSGTGVWSINRVNSNGGTETLTLAATATAVGTTTNTATITAPDDGSPANNTASVTLTVYPTPAEVPFRLRYAENTTGDIVYLANANMTCSGSGCASALNGTGASLRNNDFTMVHLDVDADAATFNSSSADLALPAGARVRFAGLYWGAAVHDGADPTIPAETRYEVRLRTPGGAYQTIAATDRGNDGYSYRGFRDVTDLVLTTGGGTYTVANVQTQSGVANRWAAWALVVAYESAASPLRNLTVFDGLVQVSSSSTSNTSVTVRPTGFTTPLTGPVNTHVGAIGMDGDRGSPGDELRLNGVAFADPVSGTNDFFNSSITRFGAHVTTRNPGSTNNLSLDADIMDAAGQLTNATTAADVTMSSANAGAEGIDLLALTFVTDVYVPDIHIEKTVEDLNGGYIEAGDELRYVIHMENVGLDTATDVELADLLPAGVAYVPGTIAITAGANAGPKTDAADADQAEYDAATGAINLRLGTGATGAAGGALPYTVTTTVAFRVRVAATLPSGSSLFNQARVTFSQATLGTTGIMAMGAARIVTGRGTDLRLAIAGVPPGVAPGQSYTYALTVTNAGPDAAPMARVFEDLPTGLSYVTAVAPGGWTVVPPGASRRLAFTTGTFPVGGTATFLVTVRVDDAHTGVLRHDALAESALPDLAPADNDAHAQTAAAPEIDLALAASVDEPAPTAGDPVVFTITLDNAGPNGATGVAVRAPLPTGLTFVSATPSAGTYSSGPGVWSVGALATGLSRTLAITATVDDTTAMTLAAEVSAADQADVDSTPDNGVTSEDDYAAASVVPEGTTGGGGGGMESNGSMADLLARVLRARRQRTADALAAGTDLRPTRFSYDGPLARLAGGADLRALVPTEGPEGSVAHEVSPFDLLPVTNATDIVAADYLRPADGRRLAVVFATATPAGEVYEHSKAVCDRLLGSTLEAVGTVHVLGRPLVMTRLRDQTGALDYAVSFSAYPQPGGGYAVDSRFLLRDYAPAGSTGDVVNVQVWGVSPAYAAGLAEEVLGTLSVFGPLTFLVSDDAPPLLPRSFVRHGRYAAGRVTLEIENPDGVSSARLTGGTLARTEGGTYEAFERTLALPAPDADGVSTVTVEVGPVFDVAFFVEVDGPPDVLYLADGAWSPAADEAGATVSRFAVEPEPAGDAPDGRPVERPAHLEGWLRTWAGLVRGLRPGYAPADLSAFEWVEFTAWGAGRGDVYVEKASIETADQFRAPFALGAEPRRYRVPFADLRRDGGAAGFTAWDVAALSFYLRGDGTTAEAFALHVTDVRFGAGSAGGPVPEALALSAAPNPARGRATVTFDLPAAGPVHLAVYDLLGREVAVLADDAREAGHYAAALDAARLASGVYVVRLRTADASVVRRVTVIR